ncbi:MAG: cytochrome c-type biogenesis protein CcmE [Gammaproteobacteria bacterium]|jgi:cytochrome c-type biogenesis protein CcmE
MIRRQRMVFVAVLVVGVAVAAALAFRAIGDNMLFFYSPSQLANGEVPAGQSIKVGGLVVDGSVRRNGGELAVQFDLTDTAKTMTVRYDGILPDLFREGQGIIALGKLGPSGTFVADEVLAKHDENYMPPDVADALEQAQAQALEPISGQVSNQPPPHKQPLQN